MKYLTYLLGLALAGALLTASIYRADAADYKAQLSSLKASYASAAVAAETHAQAVEAKQDAEREARANTAIQQATYARDKAQLAAATYRQKLAQLATSKPTDLPHICANVVIPEDLRNAGPH